MMLSRGQYFSVVVDEHDRKSKGFVMVRRGMNLTQVREKIKVQVGTILSDFLFIDDESNVVPREEEDNVQVLPGFLPNCVIRLLK
jgi:hypothetical protein